MRRSQPVALVLALVLVCGAPAGLLATDFFTESDDYKEGEEVVGVFLKDAEYQRMVEDIERNDVDLDWGWAKTTTPDERKKRRLQEPKQLGFDLRSYKTVRIPEVESFTGDIDLRERVAIRGFFGVRMEEFGLEPVEEGNADLELSMAIVDVDRDHTYIYFGTIEPSIEIELRLREVSSGQDLLLVRHQSHGRDPESAAQKMAYELVQFLR